MNSKVSLLLTVVALLFTSSLATPVNSSHRTPLSEDLFSDYSSSTAAQVHSTANPPPSFDEWASVSNSRPRRTIHERVFGPHRNSNSASISSEDLDEWSLSIQKDRQAESQRASFANIKTAARQSVNLMDSDPLLQGTQQSAFGRKSNLRSECERQFNGRSDYERLCAMFREAPANQGSGGVSTGNPLEAHNVDDTNSDHESQVYHDPDNILELNAFFDDETVKTDLARQVKESQANVAAESHALLNSEPIQLPQPSWNPIPAKRNFFQFIRSIFVDFKKEVKFNVIYNHVERTILKVEKLQAIILMSPDVRKREYSIKYIDAMLRNWSELMSQLNWAKSTGNQIRLNSSPNKVIFRRVVSNYKICHTSMMISLKQIGSGEAQTENFDRIFALWDRAKYEWTMLMYNFKAGQSPEFYRFEDNPHFTTLISLVSKNLKTSQERIRDNRDSRLGPHNYFAYNIWTTVDKQITMIKSINAGYVTRQWEELVPSFTRFSNQHNAVIIHLESAINRRDPALITSLLTSLTVIEGKWSTFMGIWGASINDPLSLVTAPQSISQSQPQAQVGLQVGPAAQPITLQLAQPYLNQAKQDKFLKKQSDDLAIFMAKQAKARKSMLM